MNYVESKSKNHIILNSYALVKASWLKDDYISSFVPMAVALVGKKAYNVIDAEAFSKDFEKEYGFKIPSHPAIKLLSIMQKQNYIRFDETSRCWNPNVEEIAKVDITSKQESLHIQTDALINEIVQYAYDQFKEVLTQDQALQMLSSFIQKNSTMILNGEFTEYQNSYKDRSIISNFITTAKTDNKLMFGIVKQITIGKLLVDALTQTENNGDSEDFSDVSVYLDTRYILNLIGFYGEYRQTSFVELADKLYQQGATLFVFKHILEEINFILRGCEKWIDSIDYDPEKASSASRYLKSCGKDHKYVQGLIVGLAARLDRHHIAIDTDSLIGDDYTLQIDRDELRDYIVSCYKSDGAAITDRLIETIGYDIDSIQAIYYKRENVQTFNLYETKVFLLTTNRNLVYASKKFHSKNFKKDTLPSCISDIYVGTFMWARSGIQYCENIMESKLIADCSIAMEPPQYAITKFCEHMNELKDHNEITEAEYIALKCYGLSTRAAQTILMNPDEYSYKDLHEVMDEIRQKTINDEKVKFDFERLQLQQQINELREKYGIKEEEFTKYRDMAMKYAKDIEDKSKQDFEELLKCSKEAENKLKVTPIIVNAVFNVIVQIALFWLTHKWLCLGLRIAVPVCSLLVGLTIQYNWWRVRDSLQYRLTFHYKKKLNNDKLKNSISHFLKKDESENME